MSSAAFCVDPRKVKLLERVWKMLTPLSLKSKDRGGSRAVGSPADAGMARGRGWNVEALSFTPLQQGPAVLSSSSRNSYTCLWRRSRHIRF